MDKKDLKTRNYLYTINNYTKKDLKKFITLAESLEKHRYICFGLEIAPTTGTKHIQGYIQLNIAQRLTFLHNYFSFTKGGELLKFHIDMANGTPDQNRDYCKKDGQFYEFGEPMSQGNRTDMTEIKNSIRDNPKNLNAIIDEQGNNLQQVRFAQTLQPIYLPKRDPEHPPTVYWIFGDTGIGKTRLVSRTFEDICYVSSYKWLGTDYNQNECFLLDDFRPGNLEFETILKITDRYPFTLEFKGSQIPLNSEYIIFTSPYSLNATFDGHTRENLQQLKRRLTEIDLNEVENIDDIDLRNLDKKYIYDNVNVSHNDF
jgi:hypothetical protein